MAGLRERKKRKTRETIRREAFRLIRAQGYDATTVDEIAAAAEVSPSTFFRYFRTKEDVVLDDGYDPQLLAAVATVPADVRPVTAIRRGLTVTLREMPPDTIAEIRAQVRLMLGVPALRAKMGEQSLTQALVFTEVIAGRSGRPATDLMVRAAAAALTGAIGAAVLAWIALPDDEGDEGAEGLIRMTDEALGALEAGFPFG